jgi:hypothetical protein
MKQLALAACSLLAVFAGRGEAAKGDVFATVGNWVVMDSDTGCTLSASYGSDTTLAVKYNMGLDRATVTVMDSKFKSVKDGKEYSILLHFIVNGKLDTGWGKIKALGLISDGGEPMLTFPLDGSDFLTDFRRAETLGLMRKNVVVGSFGLTNSDRATSKLIECSKRAQRRNPADPFAK